MAKVNIDIRAIRNIADSGVRRTAVFLGLGLNAAKNPDFVGYKLPRPELSGIRYQFVPDDASALDISEYKSQFSLWLIASGLREIIESYALFLDSIHNYCLLVEAVYGSNKHGDPNGLQANFHAKPGLKWKLDTIEERFGLAKGNSVLLDSIHKARNCLSHRQGIVLDKDLSQDGFMHVKWMAFESVITLDESGDELSFREVVGTVLKESSRIGVRLVERDKVFSKGERILLSEEELWEICLFAITCSAGVIEGFMQYLKDMGVQVADN